MSSKQKSVLVIIQAPGKLDKFRKAFGKSATVIATKGHIRDLPQKKISVNIKKDFQATYQYDSQKADIIASIKSAAKNADLIYLAADADRQGQAIAMSVYLLLTDQQKKKAVRITTNSITQQAIQQAIKHGRQMDMHLFQAFQARRILDRVCGYKSSFPVQQATGGKSAGRCQSPTLRLLVQRQKQIRAFKPQEYWAISAVLKAPSGQKIKVKLKTPKQLDVNTQKMADEIVAEFRGSKVSVSKYDVSPRRDAPSPPFTTTDLQSIAASVHGLDPQRTMRLAQDLYQNSSAITYHRTDSPYIVPQVVSQIRALIGQMGCDYVPPVARVYAAKGNAQQAHEACRPTHLDVTDLPGVDDDARRLYKLIWKRTMASQMADMTFEATSAQFKSANSKNVLSTSGKRITFNGYRQVWDYGSVQDNLIPVLAQGDTLIVQSVQAVRKQTQPPSRHTKASLPKTLQKLGIGRPATLAGLTKTLKDRGYIQTKGSAYVPTQLGIKVCDFMTDVDFGFVDLKYTSDMQADLDLIAEGKKTKLQVLSKFWKRLQSDINNAKTTKKQNQTSQFKCPTCAKAGVQAFLLLKHSKFGSFYTCQKYSDKKSPCEYKANVNKKTQQPEQKVKKVVNQSEHPCPNCGMPLIIRESKTGGSQYLGCRNFKDKDCSGFYNMLGQKNIPKAGGAKKKFFKNWKKKS